MKSIYHRDGCNLAVLDLCLLDFALDDAEQEDLRWTITRLNVPNVLRNKGIAKQMLTECCQKADENKVALFLDFVPYTGTDPERLRKLYCIFGFDDFIEPGVMVRYPN